MLRLFKCASSKSFKGKFNPSRQNVLRFQKKQLLSTGAYYKDDLGETNKEHGEWKYYSKDGKLEEVRNYYKGKLHGQVLKYWGNEKLNQEGYFVLDQLDSVYREWAESGKLQTEGYYKKDQKFGLWKSFYLDGKPRMIEEFIDTTRYVKAFWSPDSVQTVVNGNGEMINRYLDNNIKEIYHFKNGLEDGAFIEYKINGDTAVCGAYNQGLKIGEWRQFFYNGKIEKIANYKNNLLDGRYQLFYDNGKPRTTGFYKDGKKNNQWIWYAINGAFDMKASLWTTNNTAIGRIFTPTEKFLIPLNIKWVRKTERGITSIETVQNSKSERLKTMKKTAIGKRGTKTENYSWTAITFKAKKRANG